MEINDKEKIEQLVKQMKDYAAIVNKELEGILKKEGSERYIELLLGRSNYKYDPEAITKTILEPAWYLLDQGGKRWRPFLTSLIIKAYNKNVNNYIEFTIIPEVIHTATLIHDDIEDNSDNRRGMPAVHKKYSLDIATNLGDIMFFLPMNAVMDSNKLSSEVKDKIFHYFIKDMTRLGIGQATDIAWHSGKISIDKINEEKYLQMAQDKTGVLSRFACELGGILAGANDKEIEILGKFGATIGIAFQIQDDLLNIYESKVSENKGGVGDDISEGKITLLIINTLKNANESDKKELIEILNKHTKDKELINRAIQIIDKYNAKENIINIEKQLITEAWNEVDKILPQSEAKEQIYILTNFLINRNV
ncbi:MAG: polyprenyl synthetase family protein [Candidatus Micrarchaeia archaeon]